MNFLTLDDLEDFIMTDDNQLGICMGFNLLMHTHRAFFPKVYNLFRKDLYYIRFIVNAQYKILGFVTFAVVFRGHNACVVILQREIADNDNISMEEINKEIEDMVQEFGIPIIVLIDNSQLGTRDGFSTNVKVINIYDI